MSVDWDRVSGCLKETHVRLREVSPIVARRWGRCSPGAGSTAGSLGRRLGTAAGRWAWLHRGARTAEPKCPDFGTLLVLSPQRPEELRSSLPPPGSPHEQLIFLRVPLFASLPVAVAGLRLDEALSCVGRKPGGLSFVRRAPADAGAASPVVGGADGRGSSLPVVVSPALLPRAGCGSGGVSARVGVSTG